MSLHICIEQVFIRRNFDNLALGLNNRNTQVTKLVQVW